LQDNTAWYATFSDAIGAAECAAASDNKLLTGLEIPLQVDEPPSAPKNDAAHSRPAAPSAASASASHAPAGPLSSVGENPSGEALRSVSADLSTAVPVTKTVVDDVSMSEELAPPVSVTAEHHSLSKSASSRLEKRIDDLLSESRPAFNSSDTRKNGHTDETTRIMSSQSPEPDELVGEVEMEDASEQVLSKAPLAGDSATAMQPASTEKSKDTVLVPVDAQRSPAAVRISTPEQALPAKAPSPAPSTSTEGEVCAVRSHIRLQSDALHCRAAFHSQGGPNGCFNAQQAARNCKSARHHAARPCISKRSHVSDSW
jgi:hypothetical protein